MAANYTVKESITMALIRLMETKPYEKITVTDVVQRSGVCRASFYRNYTGKEDILRNYIKYAMKNCPEYYRESADHSVRQHVLGICRTMRSNCALFDTLKAHGLLHMLREEVLDMVLSFLREHNLSLGRYEISVLSYAALGVLLAWIDGGYSETETELAGLCLRLLRMPASGS